MRLKVKNEPGLVRDTTSGAIINVDETSYHKYKESKKKLAAQKEEAEMFRNQLDDLQKEFSEIKQLLSTILTRIIKE